MLILPLLLLMGLTLVLTVVSQKIWDIWQTTWDGSMPFTRVPLISPFSFGTPGPAASVDIIIDDSTLYQQIDGFGASLTDSSALTLDNLKNTNRDNYWKLLDNMFNATYDADSAGLNYIRVPLGASDFSASLYSFDDVDGDTTFSRFNINHAPSYLFSVLKDILSINDRVKVHILPWSPPGWMKDSGTMNGGNLLPRYHDSYPTYLLKAVQGFQSEGIPIYAVGIQNEPQNSNPTYPTCTISSAVEAQLGDRLRTLLDHNGLGSIKIIAYEHNWDNASIYPVQVMRNAAPHTFSGAAFHCYSASVSDQQAFYSVYPNKELYFTECTGTYGSDWWGDIKWYMKNIFIGSLHYWARAALMWNFALDGSGNPTLPGTNSCGGGCRPVVTVNNDGSYYLNQEFWSMAQASKAIIPRDSGGPFGQRIGVTVDGSLNWALVVGAYVVDRVHSGDRRQYSLVVLNWADNTNGVWNPQPVMATIGFRGQQVTYTFPVGVTTLWWFES